MATSMLKCPDCKQDIHVGTAREKNLAIHCGSNEMQGPWVWDSLGAPFRWIFNFSMLTCVPSIIVCVWTMISCWSIGYAQVVKRAIHLSVRGGGVSRVPKKNTDVIWKIPVPTPPWPPLLVRTLRISTKVYSGWMVPVPLTNTCHPYLENLNCQVAIATRHNMAQRDGKVEPTTLAEAKLKKIM